MEKWKMHLIKDILYCILVTRPKSHLLLTVTKQFFGKDQNINQNKNLNVSFRALESIIAH